MRYGDKTTETNFDIYFFPNASDIDKCMVNTSQSDMSCCGRKYFTFRFTPQKGLKPYDGSNKSRVRLIELCSSNEVNGANYCTALIMLGGWQIAKDYPRRI